MSTWRAMRFENIPRFIQLFGFPGPPAASSFNLDPTPGSFAPDPAAPLASASTVFGSTSTTVDPGVKGQYVDEWVVGYERELGGDFVVGLKGGCRRLGRVIEDLTAGDKEYFFGLSRCRRWSPDANQLAYEKEGALYVTDADGTRAGHETAGSSMLKMEAASIASSSAPAAWSRSPALMTSASAIPGWAWPPTTPPWCFATRPNGTSTGSTGRRPRIALRDGLRRGLELGCELARFAFAHRQESKLCFQGVWNVVADLLQDARRCQDADVRQGARAVPRAFRGGSRIPAGPR